MRKVLASRSNEAASRATEVIVNDIDQPSNTNTNILIRSLIGLCCRFNIYLIDLSTLYQNILKPHHSKVWKAEKLHILWTLVYCSPEDMVNNLTSKVLHAVL